MIQRRQYMSKLIKMKDEKIIRVITGIRRCGKSTLLLLFQEYLKQNGAGDDQIVSINFEDMRYESLLDYRELYEYVTERLAAGKRTYVFLDEIQNVTEFQRAVDSLFIKDNVDVYITGSNARLLSGDLATFLSGRYIEINMLPLSFAEYLELKGGGDKREAFTSYYLNGAFPQAAVIADDEVRSDYIRGIYNTVLLKDIVARKKIADVELLESVTRFLFDNIGNIVSSKKIADSLTSFGRKTTSITVENYVTALMDAYVLYKAPRYDVKGKQYLKSLEKYYAADIGLRRVVLGERNRDIGRVLENIVYLELIRRGYTVRVGKSGDKEIDFVATAGDQRIYYQVAASVLDPATFEREFEPLRSIRDHYPKFVLTMDDLPTGQDGIRQVNIVDFLLNS
ncbi:MAG: ATP-binding protein [Clostridiales bacterium]|jgi:predicted AAA+ superfamily ATPase|nr:ATP-binding protein [Clostridiales bacterium]